MARQINFKHSVKTKVKRRRKKRPLNMRKKLGKRSSFRKNVVHKVSVKKK